jgi:hypothetical protein
MQNRLLKKNRFYVFSKKNTEKIYFIVLRLNSRIFVSLLNIPELQYIVLFQVTGYNIWLL